MVGGGVDDYVDVALACWGESVVVEVELTGVGEETAAPGGESLDVVSLPVGPEGITAGEEPIDDFANVMGGMSTSVEQWRRPSKRSEPKPSGIGRLLGWPRRELAAQMSWLLLQAAGRISQDARRSCARVSRCSLCRRLSVDMRGDGQGRLVAGSGSGGCA
jgi:hypothetical protein